jgi:serine/threonine protein kinase
MDQRTILQYQLVEKIGAGGMGEIYKARDTRLNRFVAMKALSAGMAADPDRRLRFVQEAQAVSALNHPNIITIYDIVDDGLTQYMVIEFVEGKTLLELIPKGGMPIPQVIRYGSQIAEALCAAHAAGIVHRDLKPANVMITGAGLVKVLDFGLAKMIDWAAADPDGATLTMTAGPLTIEGTLLGTVNYMSPEQAEGKKLDARSDIFSFGSVLYEMLTGKAAFHHDTVLATLTSVLRDEVQPVRELAPDIPAELERIVNACLKKNPDDRVQSMQEVQLAFTALRQQSDSGTLYNIPTAAIPMPMLVPTRRSGPSPIAAIALLIILAAGGGYWWMTTHRVVPPPPVPLIHSVPSSVLALPAEAATAPAPAPAPLPPQPVSVTLPDGMPVLLTLAQVVPINASIGDPLRFRVAADVSVDDGVVIRKNTIAAGEIVDAPKKLLRFAGKMTFRLDTVPAVDGQKIPLRITVDARQASKLPVDTGAKKPKDVAAPAGTAYTAYIDGTKTVTLRK